MNFRFFTVCKKYFALAFLFLTPSVFFAQAPDSWTQMTSMPAGAAARDRAISFSINGKGYIGLGSDGATNYYDSVWEYDPTTNSWTQKADILPAYAARNRAFSFAVNGKGYFGTGWDGTTYFQGVCEYNPVTNTWTAKNNFAGGARYGSSAFVIGQKAFVVGGRNAVSVFNDVYEYNAAADTWTPRAAIPAARFSGVAFSIAGKGYCGAGYGAAYLSDFWKYDPLSNSWSQIPDLPSGPRALAAAFSFGPRGFVAGGSDATSVLADLWEYNVFTNAWIQRNSLPFGPRYGASAFVIGGTAYMGIGNNNPTVFKDLWKYTPVPLDFNIFQKSYGGTNSDTDTSNISYASPTSDGGYIISSTTKSFGQGGNDVYLMKITPSGVVQWAKTFGNTANEISSSVRPTNDGGYIIAGETRKSITDADLLVMKISGNGTFQWDRTLAGTLLSRANYAEQTNSGDEILVVGKGELAGWNNACVIKLNTSGAQVWAKDLTLTSSVDEGFSVAQTASGNYMVSGHALPGITNQDGYVVGLSPAGNILGGYQNRFASQGNGTDIRSQIRQTDDGGFIICGSSNSSASNGGYDFFLLKVQNDLTISWAKTYGGPQDDIGRSIIITNDGNFAVAGYTKSFGVGIDAFLCLINANGTPLWTKVYGGSLVDKANSVYQTADGGFIICGETFSFANPTTSSDIYLIKTDSVGGSGCNESAVGSLIVNNMLFSNNSQSQSPQNLTTVPISIVQNTVLGTANPICSKCTFGMAKGKINVTCFGGSNGSASVNPTSGLSPYTYLWSTTATTSTISGLAAGTYSVLVVDANSCSAIDTVKILQPTALLLNTSADSMNICIGNSTTLGANASGGFAPYSYLWSPATGLSCTSCQIPVANPTSNTAYLISITDSNLCTKQDTIQVMVHSPPNAVAGPDQTICAGSPVGIGAAPVSGVNYQWSPATGLNNATLSNPNASPVVTTTYVVTASNAPGCSKTDNVVVTVIASPTVSISASSPTTICSGSTTSLTATSNAPNYQWSTGSTAATIFITPSATTGYTVSVSAGTCTVTSSMVVNVVQSPTVSITNSSGTNTVCTGSIFYLSGTGAGNYLWSTGSTGTAIAVSYSVTGTFINTLTITAGGNVTCSDTDADTVTVVSSPVISVSATYTTICSGLSVDTLKATGGGTYVWLPGGQTASAIVVSPDVPTTYSVIVSNSGGCTGTTSVFVNVIPLNAPVVSPLNYSYCAGQPILPITATPSSGMFIGWTDVLGNPLLIGNPVYDPPDTLSVGSHTILCVQGGGTLQCLSYPTQVTIVVNPGATANAGPDITICAGHTAQLQASGGVTYSWTADSSLSANNVSNPSANPDSTFTYEVLVTDANGCKDKDSVKVVTMLSDSCGIHIFNVISPNSDGNNDGWWIDGINAFPDNNVRIFNRWGTQVWSGKNYDNKKIIWRGRNEQGEPLPAGTYYYVIHIKNKTYSKWVELLR